MIDLNAASPQMLRGLASQRAMGNESVYRFYSLQLEATKQRLVIEEDPQKVRVLQGYARAFTDLIAAVDDAVKMVK